MLPHIFWQVFLEQNWSVAQQPDTEFMTLETIQVIQRTTLSFERMWNFNGRKLGVNVRHSFWLANVIHLPVIGRVEPQMHHCTYKTQIELVKWVRRTPSDVVKSTAKPIQNGHPVDPVVKQPIGNIANIGSKSKRLFNGALLMKNIPVWIHVHPVSHPIPTIGFGVQTMATAKRSVELFHLKCFKVIDTGAREYALLLKIGMPSNDNRNDKSWRVTQSMVVLKCRYNTLFSRVMTAGSAGS